MQPGFKPSWQHPTHHTRALPVYISLFVCFYLKLFGFTFRVVIVKELLSCCCGRPWCIMTTLYKGLPLPYVTFWCVRYVVLEI